MSKFSYVYRETRDMQFAATQSRLAHQKKRIPNRVSAFIISHHAKNCESIRN